MPQPGVVVLVDGDGVAVSWSAAAAAELGWALHAGSPRSPVIDPQLLPTVADAPPRRQAVSLQRQDGSVLEASCVIIPVGDGEAVRYAIIAQPMLPLAGSGGDVTELQWLTALVSHGKDVQFVVSADGTILFVSDVESPPLGYSPAESVGRPALQFVHPDDQARAQELLDRAVAAPGPPLETQVRGHARDGSWRWVEVTVSNLLDHPAVRGLVVNMRDVTERRRMETALRESEARYRSIVEAAQEGIWLLDDTGQTLFANRSLAGILARDLDAVSRMNVFEVLSEDVQEEAFRRLASRRTAGHEVYEIPFVRGDGASRWASVSASPLFVNHEYVGSLLMISDVTDRKLAEHELERRALYDHLTGLPNRTLLHDRLRQAVRRRSPNGSLAVFFIDLDDFKAVNDSYGHDVGDQLLREVASRLAMIIREGDTVARFAGDEFVMVCPDVDGEIEANAIALRMLRDITQPIQVQSYLISIDASIGISLQEHARDPAQMVRDADLAMFDAKKHGRGRHVVFDARTARHSRYHLEDVQELRRGLDRREVTVFFQPQVELDGGDICSVEALARWRHPDRGLLDPSEFIGLAEASGLIVRLGQHVLEQACAQAARWMRVTDRPVPVAVNLSARQLDDEDLPEMVRRALEHAELPPELLSLEITETAVMSDTERAERVLRELHDQGIRLSIDDFGTGYSSLLHLKRLPVDEIKIDRAFVDGVDQPGDDHSIVAAVINMASALDLRIVGEGVETESQAEALIAMGCGIAQGYLYGPPMDARRINARIDPGG